MFKYRDFLLMLEYHQKCLEKATFKTKNLKESSQDSFVMVRNAKEISQKQAKQSTIVISKGKNNRIMEFLTFAKKPWLFG